jgi:hypothetical protein
MPSLWAISLAIICLILAGLVGASVQAMLDAETKAAAAPNTSAARGLILGCMRFSLQKEHVLSVTDNPCQQKLAVIGSMGRAEVRAQETTAAGIGFGPCRHPPRQARLKRISLWADAAALDQCA